MSNHPRTVYNFSSTAGVGPFIQGANDSVNGNWTYTYDNFQRLSGSSCSGNCPLAQSSVGFNYLYDPMGNRWKQTLNCTGCSGPQPQYSFGSWNHISGSGITYDSAGNMTSDGPPPGHTYFYDGENRLIKVDNGSTATYKYDAMGRRVTQTTSAGSFEFLMDLQGNPVTKLVAGTSTTSSSEVFIGGRHWGTDVMSSSLLFMHSDWLGTGRAWTNLSGTVVQDCQSFPFGDSLYCAGSANNTDDNFAGMTYDLEDPMYHASFREYSPVQGRWIRPDPAGLAAVDPTNPQTWNRYAYVMNNPVSAVDPLGLWCVWEDGTHDDDPSEGGASSGDCVDQGGHWDQFDTITGIFQQNGIVTQMNTIWGTVTAANGLGTSFSLSDFDTSLQTAGCPNGCSSLIGVPFAVQPTGFEGVFGGPGWTANGWGYRIVDIYGNPIRGSYKLTEHLQSLQTSGNIGPPNPTLNQERSGASFIDGIGGSSSPFSTGGFMNLQQWSVNYGGQEYMLEPTILQMMSIQNGTVIQGYPTIPLFP